MEIIGKVIEEWYLKRDHGQTEVVGDQTLENVG